MISLLNSVLKEEYELLRLDYAADVTDSFVISSVNTDDSDPEQRTNVETFGLLFKRDTDYKTEKSFVINFVIFIFFRFLTIVYEN